MGEGLSSSVAVTRLANGILSYHNAGKVQASSDPEDMRLQRMLGHLTTLMPAQPEVGARHRVRRGRHGRRGLGGPGGREGDDRRDRTARLQHRGHLFQPLQPRRASATRRCTMHIDDARHFLTTTKEKFDAITSDPLDPWVKGAAMLYTKEFFELAKRHLNPGGAVTIFVQLYQSNEEAVKSEIGTFFDAFPNGVVFANTDQQHGLRPRAARPGGADQDRRRPVAGEARSARVQGDRPVAARDRLPVGDRAARHLLRAARRIWADG